MSEWRPIETAPKDGTIIDLWISQRGRRPGCAWVDNPEIEQRIGHCWADECFRVVSLGDYATHWMPLPERPEENNG